MAIKSSNNRPAEPHIDRPSSPLDNSAHVLHTTAGGGGGGGGGTSGVQYNTAARNTSTDGSNAVPSGDNNYDTYIAQRAGKTIAVVQSGTWNIVLYPGSNVIGSISNTAFGISGSLPAGTNAIGSITNTTFGATQSGTWNVNQAGTWNVGITGSLPAYAATPTFKIDQTTPGTTNKVSIGTDGTVVANLGTLNGAALDTSVQQVKTALGSPFQAGGSIANTSFGISGTLPAYAAIPTFKVDQTTPGTTNKVSIGTDGVVVIANASSNTDRSGTTSATAGTFTTPIAANTNRRFLRITNINASGILYIYDKTGGTPNTTTNCYPLQPGGSTTYDARVPSDAIQIAGSAVSLKFEAAEG